MSTMIHGAIAGAVGTMALDVSSYADIALRARDSSDVPAETVKRLSQRAGIPIENDNRASALGALSGYAVGVGIGALYGVIRPRVPRVPLILSGFALGAAAMLASEGPATRLGATDPRTWGVGGWLSDIIPHVAYGLVTAAVFDAVTAADGASPMEPAETSEVVTEVDAVVFQIDDLSD